VIRTTAPSASCRPMISSGRIALSAPTRPSSTYEARPHRPAAVPPRQRSTRYSRDIPLRSRLTSPTHQRIHALILPCGTPVLSPCLLTVPIGLLLSVNPADGFEGQRGRAHD